MQKLWFVDYWVYKIIKIVIVVEYMIARAV